MASEFLKKKAQERAAVVDKEYGPDAYGGSKWREENSGGKKAAGGSGSDGAKAEKKASSFLQRKAAERAAIVDKEYGSTAYGGSKWRESQGKQTSAPKRSYYSSTEMQKNREYLYSDITDIEPAFLEKRQKVETAAKNLERLAAQVKLSPENEALYNSYKTAYDNYTKLWAEFEPIQASYSKAVNAYNDEFSGWKGTIRDATEIDAALAALDEQAAQIKRDRNAYASAASYGRGHTDTTNLAGKTAELTAQLDEIERQRALLVEEKQWAEHFSYADLMDGADFEEYSAKGAAIENPEKLDGGKINNVVTFFRNSDQPYVDKYDYMTDGEVSIYNYILAKEGEESAAEYLKYMDEHINARKGKEMGEDVRGIDNWAGRVGATGLYGLVAGVDQFAGGVHQFFSREDLPTSAMQYGSQYIQEDLADNKVGSYLYNATTTIGNMAPSILASTVLGPAGLGVSGAVAAGVGSATMGVSAAGNAYGQALEQGYSEGRARTYSTLVGASEAALQYALGGVGKLGGLADDVLLAKVNAIDNALARVALTGAVKLGSEITEEELQNFLEPMFAAWIFSENYDAPTVEELVETAIVTALSTGVLEGGSIISAGGKQTANLGAEIKGMDSEAMQSIIEEGLATPADSSSYILAEKLQQKLERGEAISDQEIGNLQQQNEQNVDMTADPDAVIAQAAAEAVSREMGAAPAEATETAQERVSPAGEETPAQTAREASTPTRVAMSAAAAASVPYNVLNNAQKAKAGVLDSLGYLDNGTRAFESVVEATGMSVRDVRSNFQTAYEAGLRNVPASSVSFVNPIQKAAYAAGLKDYGVLHKQAVERDVQMAKQAPVQNKGKSGFQYDVKHLPANVSQGEAVIIDELSRMLGVSTRMVGQRDYNAKLTGTTDVEIASDFQTMMKGRKTTVIDHAVHEMAGHQVIKLAPVEGRAFMNAMYGYLSENLPDTVATLAEEKTDAYGQKDVALSTHKAMEEVVVSEIFPVLYSSDPAQFKAAMDRVMNGKDEQAKKGARTFKEVLNDLWKKLKSIAAKLRGKGDVDAAREAEQAADRVKELRDMFEDAMRVAAQRVQNAQKSANETGRADGNRDTMYHLKDVQTEFQRKFTGQVMSDQYIDLSSREKSAIAHALKTGYGRIDVDGQGGGVSAFGYYYLFDVTRSGGVRVTDVINHNDLNIHEEKYGGVYDEEGRYDHKAGAAAESSGRGSGYGAERVAATEKARKGREDGLVDGAEQGRDAGGNLQEVQRTGKELTANEQSKEFSDRDTDYSLREKDPPKKVGIAYKVFYAKDGQLYPPMVANPGGAGTPVGVWLDADVAASAPPSKTGRPQVQAGGKGTNAGKMSLAFRPGWHLGDLPIATQFARKNPETGKKELFPADFVWAECEYAMDHDYQEEAMSYGYTENGKFRHSYAGLPRLPEDGYYRYRTNPNPDTVPWVITGAMRVKRILTDAETDKILRDAGVEPMKRQGGELNLEKLGLTAGEQYSMKDSSGRTLTQKQAEFFKDSQVRDENGNLLVVYHGTRNGGFTVFNRNHNYYTDSRDTAESYAPAGEVYEGYLNITKPFIIEANGEKWSGIPVSEEVKKMLDAAGGSTFKERGQWRTSVADIVSMIEDMVDEGEADFDGVIVRNVDDTGSYFKGDGKNIGTDYITFKSEQFKNADNANPTDDPDINFSMKTSREDGKNLLAIHNKNAESILAALDLGGFPMPSIAIVKNNMGHEKFGDTSILFRKDTIDPQLMRRNKVYGADAWTPTKPSVGYKVNEKVRKKLEDRIEKLLEGTTLKSEYRLMLDDTNVDDQMNRFDGDFKRAYSRNEALKIAFLKDKGIPFKPVMKDHKYNGTLSNDALRNIVQEIGATRIIEAWHRDNGAIMEFEPVVRKYYNARMEEMFAGSRFLEKSIVDEVPWAKVDTILRDAISFFKNGPKKVLDSAATTDRLNKKFTKKLNAEYEAWLDEVSAGIIEKKGLRNDKDMFTPSGNRRSFEQLYMEYNLDNIVAAMANEEEKGGGVLGTGNIFGAATKEYSSISEIKADSDRLVMEDEEAHKAEHDAFTDRLHEIVSRMLKPGDTGFGATLDAGDAAVDALLRGKTVKGIRRELKSWRRFNATEQIAQDIYDLAQDISEAPTTYFEAKPRRAVGFDEVAAVVMPRNGSAELKSRLEDMGIQVLTYNPNKEGDRLKKINSVKDIQFSMKEQKKMMRDNARLKEVNAALKAQFQTTKFAKADPKALRSMARDLLKDYDSDADIDDIQSDLDFLYTYLANDDPHAVPATEAESLAALANSQDEFSQPSKWNTAFRMAYDIARDIVEAASVTDDTLWREYEGLRNYLRTTGISMDRRYEGDLAGYEGLNDFRKRNFGRIKIVNNGLDVNTAYNELAGMYPALFNDDDVPHPGDQLTQLADVLDSLEPQEFNPYGHEIREAATWLANDIMERFFELPQAKPTFADKAERRLTEQVIKDAKRVDEVRERSNERVSKIIAEYREKVKEVRKQEKAAKWEKVEKVKEHYREKESKMSESRRARVLRERITRHASELKQKLLRGTDKKHIPQELQGAVAKLLECINLESKYEYAVGQDGRMHRVERGTAAHAEPAKRTQAFAELQAVYAQLANELTIDPDLLGDDGLLNEVVKLADKPIASMTSAELQTIWETMRAVESSVRTANKTHNATRWNTVVEAAEALREDNKGKKDKVELRGVFGKAQKLTGLDMETPETYFHLLGKAGEDLFRMMRDSQDQHIRLMNEVSNFTHETLGKINVRKLESNMHDVTLGGEKVKLSTAQIMELYVLMKREQALDHIFVGGILPDVVSAKGIKKITKAKPVRDISMSEVSEAVNQLTEEQRKIADRLQLYASNTLSKWGNKASVDVYGYEKFGEKNYWPIRVNRQEVKSDVQKDTAVTSLANRSFTKGTRPHANNSLRLGSIFDTFATHSSEMATYSAWLGTLDDINRIRNFTFKDEDSGHAVDTVKGIIDTVHGTSGNAYLDKLLSDVTNGVKGTHGETAYMSGLVGNFKAAAVGANLRVIIQQPTAMLRAADMIGAQYLAAPGNPIKGWNKAKKYAPIAVWKDWGYFDINTGRQMKDVLFDSDTAVDKVKSITMWGAGAMDSLAWGQLWNAAEAETKAKRQELKPGTEAFYEAVAKRFTEIVDHTQVVDGILQRSQIMRSADSVTKMATSFMGEPTKQYNMMMQAAYDVKKTSGKDRKGAVKKLVRTASVLAISGVANAMAQAIIDAVRDDDKEKEYWEKLLASFKENLGSTFNPVGYIPFAKDVLSILQGYDVTRMDMESIEKLVSAGQNMINALSGEGKYTVGGAAINLVAEIARLVGIPVSNLKREITSFAMLAAVESDNYLMQYRMEKWMLNMNGNGGKFVDILFNAYQNDKDAYEIIYADMVDSGYDPEKIKTGMETRMKKDQGVDKVSDLEQRYLPPLLQPEYDKVLGSVKQSHLWGAADEEQRDNLEGRLYTYVCGTEEANDLYETIEDGKSYGIDETEYLLYKLALEMYDTPNKSGELGGTPTNAEKAAAILAIGSLSDSEIAYLWDTEKGYEAYASGVDMGAYVGYLGSGETINLDKMIEAMDYGIGTDTYIDFLDMLNKYDQPSKSGKMGSFTQDEATAAIAAMPGLSSSQRAYLWQSVNKSWKSKNNPWR